MHTVAVSPDSHFFLGWIYKSLFIVAPAVPHLDAPYTDTTLATSALSCEFYAAQNGRPAVGPTQPVQVRTGGVGGLSPGYIGRSLKLIAHFHHLEGF